MPTKRVSAGLALFALVLSASLGLHRWAAAAEAAVWFYRAESPAGRVTYFYPSFHLQDSRVPRPPMTVLDSVSRLVLEADIDEAKAHPEKLARYVVNQAPLDLAALFTPAEITAIRSRAACNGVGPDDVQRLRLFFIDTMVSLPCPTPGPRTFEEVMEQAAEQRGLRISALEGAEEQLAVLVSFPDRLYVGEIKKYAAHPEAAERLVGQMVGAYKEGKYDALYDLSMANAPKNAADRRLYVEKLLLERNRTMVKRMAEVLADGDALVVVGALHFPGKGGIIDLLRRQGFAVTIVDASGGSLR